jgi:hypothetical protein
LQDFGAVIGGAAGGFSILGDGDPPVEGLQDATLSSVERQQEDTFGTGE